MRVLFTGASSFTGSWILKALSSKGHEVGAIYTRHSVEAYQGLRRRRVEMTVPMVQAFWDCRTHDGSLARLLSETGSWDLLCLHGAEVGDYKSPNFDWRAALLRNTEGLSTLLEAFLKAGGRSVVYTGSYFEADEGQGTMPLRAFSPYGLSKTLTWQALRFECDKLGLSLGKFVLPNPVGPYEEPKMVSYLVDQWKAGRVPIIACPDYIRDNAPVHTLAAAYADFAVRTCTAPRASLSRVNPSGWVSSNGDFVTRVAREFSKLSGRDFSVELGRQTTWAEPRERYNTEPCPGHSEPGDLGFWKEWHSFYFEPEKTDATPVT